MPPLAKGLIIGFSIAAPVGPIALLCVRRSLTAGRVVGLVSGFGAATADALYGIIAALGLTALTNLLLEYQRLLQLGGGAFLLYLGLATLRAPASTAEARAVPSHSLVSAYISTFLLTLSNPMTILSFLGIFAGLGLGDTNPSAYSATLLVSGVFLGSAAWWVLLSFAAAAVGARLKTGGLRAINVVAGLTITVFGVWQLSRLL
jgi:threonine/homoserine/homoserine lactone efflux protein